MFGVLAGDVSCGGVLLTSGHEGILGRVFRDDGLYLHEGIIGVIPGTAAWHGDPCGAVPLVGVVGNLALSGDGNTTDAVIGVIGVIEGHPIRTGKGLLQPISIVGVRVAQAKRPVVTKESIL